MVEEGIGQGVGWAIDQLPSSKADCNSASASQVSMARGGGYDVRAGLFIVRCWTVLWRVHTPVACRLLKLQGP